MRLHHFAAAHVVCPVPPLDQHVGKDFGDKILRLLIAEENDCVDRFEVPP